MTQPTDLATLLSTQAVRWPDRPALLAPGRTPLTYAQLAAQVHRIGPLLRAQHIQGQTRVAVMLPTGPEWAVAFLAVAASAICVPLDPLTNAAECARAFSALRVQALLLLAGAEIPARAVAQAHGLTLLECTPLPEAPAGLWTLSPALEPPSPPPRFSQADEVAVIVQTSGTTSLPKSVLLTQRNLCASAAAMAAHLQLTPHDCYLNLMPWWHIFGLTSTSLAMLWAGGSIVCTPGLHLSEFFDWLTTFRPTWYAGTPVMLQAIVAQAEARQLTPLPHTLRFIRAGSALLPAQVRAALHTVFQVPVLESYGMTEATGHISCDPLPPGQHKPGSAGISSGAEIAIMDADGVPLPADTVGEIVLRGASITPGYEDSPAANRAAFRAGWFRTGDAGYLDAEGYLYIRGRFQELIQCGDTTVIPWDVDAALAAHPAVAQAVTFPVPEARRGHAVAAAVVLQAQQTVTVAALRDFVVARLPAAQVPEQIYLVPRIPLAASGKVQRLGLAAQLGLIDGVPAVDVSAEATPTEAALLRLWEQVFGRPAADRSSDFFASGGDSLLATQLVVRVRDLLGVEVPMAAFLATPTVAGMAHSIDVAAHAGTTPPLPPLHRVAPQPCYPLSAAQQRLWLLEQLGRSEHAYHLWHGWRLHGALNRTALHQSLQAIVQRHAALRTTFHAVAGVPQQRVAPSLDLPLPECVLTALAPEAQADQVQHLAQALLTPPFDLAQGPLLRAQLVRLAPDTHVFMLVLHHIISDAWSHTVFWRELVALYTAATTGTPAPLPALPIQYPDFALWEQHWLQSPAPQAQRAYWQHQLRDLVPLQLRTDHPRPALPRAEGARQHFQVSLGQTQALKRLSQRQGVTLFMTLLAAFQVVLRRYTEHEEVVLGTLSANRTRSEVEGLLGFFVNTLVLRTDLSGNPPFTTLLARVRAVTLDASAHQELPYEQVLEALQPVRDVRQTPLFQVLFVLQSALQEEGMLPGLTVEALTHDSGATRFELALEYVDTASGLHGYVDYRSDLFDASTIARLAQQVQTVLASIVADPTQRLADIPVLPDTERQRLLVTWNATAMPEPARPCVPSLFEAQVARTPDAVALIYEATRLTYAGLQRQANQVAHLLQAHGVTRGSIVGLCLRRSPLMVAGLLGILKAGAAYLPLDPAYPRERLALMLSDAQPPVVLTQSALAATLAAPDSTVLCLDAPDLQLGRYPETTLASDVGPDDVAYVLYTSGSTGRPKGVLGVHRAVVNALAWMWQTFPLAAQDVCCQKTSISFGDSMQELWGPLLHGQPLVLIPEALLTDLQRLVATLGQQGVTRLILVPSLLRALLDTFPDLRARLPQLTLWFAGGEALPVALVQQFRAQLPGCRLINLYGASEASDDTTWYDTSLLPDTATTVPIGRPIANTQVYVLDAARQPVPLGVPGELYVGGLGLTQGYLRQPALTAARFVPHPWSDVPGARLYQTGDLVRYQLDGQLEYLGRLDQQIKLRGVRMELGEIEAALEQHPAVRASAVILDQADTAAARLIAYVSPTPGTSPPPRALRQHVATQLPAAMVPSLVVVLPTLPLTPSGKIDRRALPAPEALPTLPTDTGDAAPRTPLEQQLAAVWATVLGHDRVGREAHFFELGGHSLLAMQLLARVRKVMQVDVSLVQFFQAPTVGEMAALIAASPVLAATDVALPLVPVSRQAPVPASMAQEQFWQFDQMLPGVPLFHIPSLVQVTGALDLTLFQETWRLLMQRHEALRTALVQVAGQLRQVIAPSLPVPLTMYDVRDTPSARRDATAQRLLHALHQQPFALAQAPLFRLGVVQVADESFWVLLSMHHSMGDGWSLGVLMREMACVYDACHLRQPADLPALPVQYADVAAWQGQWMHTPQQEAQLAYWRAQLQAPLPGPLLPTDRPRGHGLHIRTAYQFRDLPPDVWSALRTLSQQENCTPFMVCLAALLALVHGTTDADDLCLATLVANRPRPEVEGIVGLFVNTVLLRTSLAGQPSGRELLQRVRATALAAYAHQALPFEAVIRMLEREQQVQRTTLGQVLVVWQDMALWPVQYASSTLRFETMEYRLPMPEVAVTSFEVVLTWRERPDGLGLMCLYKTDVFTAATITRLLDDFATVLARLCATPAAHVAALGAPAA